MRKFLCIIIATVLLGLSACMGIEDEPQRGNDSVSSAESAYTESSADESDDLASADESFGIDLSFDLPSAESSEESEPAFTAGDYDYYLVNTVAMICAYNGSETEITIPSELDGYTVTAITGDAFQKSPKLKKITLSDTVVNVGDGAFSTLTELEYIYIGSSTAAMQSTSFMECAALKEIEVSSVNKSFSSLDGVLYNGDKTALLCCPRATELEELELPETVTAVEENAFYYCTGLKKVILPTSCQLGARAFFYCMDMEEIVLGEETEQIPEKCFFGCVMLKEISIPEGVSSIGDYAYFGCISAKSATIPESVTEIGENVFKSCSALEKITVKGEYLQDWYDSTGKDYINT